MRTELVLVTLAVGLLAGCQQSEQKLSQDSTTAVAQEDKATAQALEQYRKPSYVMKEGREYGYEAAMTAEDRARGVAASKLQMFRFLGRVGDTYQVGMRDGESVVIFEGAAPFEFAKVYAFVGDRLIDKQALRLQRNAIAALALKDALYGNLEQYRGARSGKDGHLMLDAQAGRIVFVADR